MQSVEWVPSLPPTGQTRYCDRYNWTYLFVLKSFGFTGNLVTILNICVVATADEIVGYGLVEVLIGSVDWPFGDAILIPPELLKLFKCEMGGLVREYPRWLFLILLDIVKESLEFFARKLFIAALEFIVQPPDVSGNALGNRMQAPG